MKKRIIVFGMFFICAFLSAQDSGVCKDEAEKIVEELNDISYNKCVIEKTSTANKNSDIIKSRISNRLHLSVSNNTRTTKKSMRYLNKRKRKLNAVINTLKSSNELNTDASKEILFALVDELPKFINCEENSLTCFNNEFRSHFAEYFRYPEQAVKDKIEGRVFVKFIIDRNGNIDKITTYSSGHKQILEDEVKRILMSFPKLEAGKENGKNINVVYSIPVDFKL